MKISGKLGSVAQELCESKISSLISEIDRREAEERRLEREAAARQAPSYAGSGISSSFDAGSYVDSLGLKWWSDSGLDRIRNDPALTDSQKEEALSYYRSTYD